MADKKIKLDLEIATKQAQASIKDAAKEAKKLGTTLDDTRSAGKKLADAMDTVASVVDDELTQAVKAADKLEQAIGVDGVEAFKKNGKSVDDLVAELKNAGLTYKDIEDDVDDLAQSLKRLNDVGDKIDQHVTKNMQGVVTQSDKASSVTANFMGNMAQELPGVAGAFGPLNTAISQFAEYGAEGDLAVGNLITSLGIMAGAYAAFQGLGFVIDQVRSLGDWEREATKRAEEMKISAMNAADGLDVQTVAAITAKDAVIAYADEMRNSNDSKVRDAIVNDKELVDTMIEYGISMDEVIAASRSLTAQRELDLKVQAIMLERGDAYLVNHGKSIYADNERAESAIKLNKLIFRNAQANDAATQSLVQLAIAGDVASITYLKVTDQLDLLTPAEQRAAQAALDKAAADDVAAEAARKRADEQARLRAELGDMAVRGDQLAMSRNANAMPGFASGTNNAPGGPALVGEQGPEIVNLNAGDTVTTAGDTKRLLGSTYIDNRRTYVYTPPFSPTSTYESNYRYLKRNGLL